MTIYSVDVGSDSRRAEVGDVIGVGWKVWFFVQVQVQVR